MAHTLQDAPLVLLFTNSRGLWPTMLTLHCATPLLWVEKLIVPLPLPPLTLRVANCPDFSVVYLSTEAERRLAGFAIGAARPDRVFNVPCLRVGIVRAIVLNTEAGRLSR